MKNVLLLSAIMVAFFSCEEELHLTFSEVNSLIEEGAVVEINMPIANGEGVASKSINSTLDNHIANILNFSEDQSASLTMDEAIAIFQKAYSDFKIEMDENSIPWEATFDGDLIYQSSEIICIAVNAYTNTGGAHGNMNITLFNFNAQSGKPLELKDLVNDEDEFTKIVESHFKKEIQGEDEASMKDYFFGEGFHLPANIGFNDDGVLILYNVYEIASYANGITEFTIPFEDLISVLNSY
ncbi:MAG: DUF3298 and DUF4163 domain-containing protein [Bacteroidia bacterium]|nr:DUF3298 and DUF4163 domain-containing protein [Bacteroidia bacterium]NND26907.1 DUF3298 domain-containing protein [Flavobacteriaceae bacterium]MBT8277800.1 DUF3298 and DUF4163 domain-containing protein [Bacteroidia bacterium]NNK61184.1 DUF3298 domain-containing protein [Flavobacteriaceae bacterium]NNL31791.1 DUF3298 domain-containing protein [Flavobacteriaceae bacterium]